MSTRQIVSFTKKADNSPLAITMTAPSSDRADAARATMCSAAHSKKPPTSRNPVMIRTPSRNTITSRSIAAYASRSGSPPIVTIATAPSSAAAGRFKRSPGICCAAISRYVTRSMTRRAVATRD